MLMTPIEALKEPAKLKDVVRGHIAALLERLANNKAFAFWSGHSLLMNKLFDTFFSLMEYVPIAIHVQKERGLTLSIPLYALNLPVADQIPNLSYDSVSGDKMLAVHMSQIMCDCLEKLGSTKMNRDLVVTLLNKLVATTGEDDEDDEDDREMEDEDDFDEEMAHTQEMPEEKEKRETKQKKRKMAVSSELQTLLAADVIKASAKHIEPTVAAIVNDAVSSTEDEFLSQRLSALVLQLVQLSGPLTSRVLTHLIPRLGDPRAPERHDAVEAAKAVFLSPFFYVNGCTEYNVLFNPFLSRMKDSDADIRLTLISFAQEYLVMGTALTAGQTMVFEALRERVADREVKVRVAAIEVYSAVATAPGGIDRIDIEGLKDVGVRALDRADSVRSAASLALTHAYRAAVTSLLTAFEEDEETELAVRSESSLTQKTTSSSRGSGVGLQREPSSLPTTRQEAKQRLALRIKRFEDYFASIPSKIIERVLAKDITFEERSTLDTFISETLLHFCGNAVFQHKEKHASVVAATKSAASAKSNDTPSKSTKRGAEMKAQSEKNAKSEAAERAPDATSNALHLTLIISSLTESGRKGFLKWLEDKKAVRDDIRNALSTRNSDNQIREAIEKRYGKFGKLSLNESLREQLLQAVDPTSLESRVTQCITGMVRNTKNGQAQKTIVMVVRKLYFKAFNTGVAQALVAQLTSLSKKLSGGGRKKTGGDDDQSQHMERIYEALSGGDYPTADAQLSTTLEILQRSAAIHPINLVPALEQLDELLKNSKDKRVTQAAARMSSLAASLATNREAREDHIKSLTDVIKSESDTKIAAEAGAALMALFSTSEDPADAQVEADEFIADRLETALGEMDEGVAPAFAALTPLVKFFTSSKALPVLRYVTKLIEDSLQAKPRTSLTKEFSAAPAEHATPLTRAAAEGIQFCVSWLRTLPGLLNITGSGSGSARKTGPHTPISRATASSPFKTPKNSRAGGASTTPGSASSRRKSMESAMSPTRPTFKLSTEQHKAVSNFAAALRNAIDDEHNDVDHAWLRAVAITAALRLFETRVYDDLFDLHFYLRMSEIMMDESLPMLVSNEIRATLSHSFSHVHRLPLKYLPFAVILAGEPINLPPILELRRTYTKNRTSALLASKASDVDEAISRVLSNYLPEYSLPWLIFILAHSSYLEDDAPAYKRTWEYLETFLSAVMLSSNFDFLYQLLDDIRQLDDALEPGNNNIHVVAELGLNVIGELRANDPKLQRPDLTGSSMDPKKVMLPQTLFKLRYAVDERSGQKMIQVASNLPSLLPVEWRSPFKRTSSIIQGSDSGAGRDSRKSQGRKKKTAAKKTRARKPEEDDEDSSPEISSDTDEEMQFSSDEEGGLEKKRRRANGKSGAKSTGKGSNSKKSQSAKDVAPPAKRTTPARKAKSALPKDAFDESTDESDDGSSESESDNAPAPPRGKRAKPTAKPKSKSTTSVMDVDDEEESASEDMKAPPSKRPKRAAAAAATPSKRTPITASKTRSRKADTDASNADSESEEIISTPASRRSTRATASPKPTSPAAKVIKSPPKKPVVEDPSSESDEPAPAPRPKRPAPSAKKTSVVETPKAKSKSTSTKATAVAEESSEEEMKEPPAKRSKRLAATSSSAKTSPKPTAKKTKVDSPSSSEDEGEELSTPARRTRRAVSNATETPSTGSKRGKSTAAKSTGRKK